MHAKVKPNGSRKRTRPTAARRGAPARATAVWQTPAFLAAIDASPDLIYITDPETVRFLYVNETACRMHGCTREEYLRLTPAQTLGIAREELRRVYQEIIKTGSDDNTVEFLGVSKDGSRRGWFEAHRRAVRLGERWAIVTITRDITRRRRAEKTLQRLGRMYATLSATNEAIMHARSPQELYQGVCDAAVHNGRFINAFVVVPEADSRYAKIVAVAGDQQLHTARISLDAETPEGRGLVGAAFRTRAANISNDFLNDPHTRPWHAQAQTLGIAASAAVPVRRGDGASGVLVFHSGEKRAFDEEIVGLFERMARNIAFALDNFEREAQRIAALSRERFTRLYTALSATNEAIMRSATPEELFQRVCDAAVDAGKLSSTSVFVVATDSEWLMFAGGAGTGMSATKELRICVDPNRAEGRGLIGSAIRTRAPSICNDLDANPNMLFWADMRKQTGANSGAAFPIQRGDQTIGAIAFYALERGAFDEEIVRLLERMSDNVSFALDNFERETERRQAEAALRASEEKYRAILENMYEGYFEVDLKGNYVFLNNAMCRIHGGTRDELMGANYRDYAADEETAERVLAIYHAMYRSGSIDVPAQLTEWSFKRKDGTLGIWQSSVQLIVDKNGKLTGFRGVARDVTDRRRAEEVLRESEARFRALTDLSSDWYWELDADLRFSRAEGRSDIVSSAVLEGSIGKHPWDIGVEVDGGWDEHRSTLEARKPFREFLHHRSLADGGRRYYTASGEPLFDAAGRFVGYRGVARDITAQVLAEQRIQYMATHDGLTALPNRPMFSRLLTHAIESARRYRRQLAVLFIDLDRFKFINDTLGHEAGDVLLQEMAKRLTRTLRASDIIARFGGDEFVVLLPEISDVTEGAGVANKILAALLEPVRVAEQECRVTASIGISTFPDDAQDEQSLMKNADMAMYLAKAEGKNNYQFYSQEIRTEARERLILENNLRRALEEDEFFLHYQPKVDLQTGAITGVEALLRWHNPELGSVPPARFIPLAEETGLIVPIGRWVLRTACAQGVAWQRQGLPGIRIAVNLSARQFSDENLLADITAALTDSGMSASLLELEITEGMVMQNPDRAVQKLNRIRDMGLRLAIDDFGTGYSSLAQLKRFPIDTLKVDRSFISDIPGDSEDVAITQAIIAMGKRLDLTVVAEGVETLEQMQFLREQRCDQMQGYYFSKPIAAEPLAALLRAHEVPHGAAIPSPGPSVHGASDEK